MQSSLLTGGAVTLPPGPVSLLTPTAAAAAALDFDQLQRYAFTARLLDRLLAGATPPLRILEVGSSVLNLLPRFLDPGRVQVTRCDVQPYGDDPDFVLIEKDRPLPFADETFDAVAALEVLEHMPADRRGAFLADCLRVARRGAVFTCPNGVAEVVQAEQVADAAFRRRHGKPHPFLEEHRQFGLPREEEITALLHELGHPFAVFDNAPLDLWLPMLLVSENLTERSLTAACQGRMNHAALHGRLPARSLPYRKVYVCAKSFDAAGALEPSPVEERAAPPAAPEWTRLECLAAITSDALGTLADTYWETVAAHQSDAAELKERLHTRGVEMQAWRQRHVVAASLAASLMQSWSWKLLAPLRGLRRLLRPRGFDAGALLPWQQLEPVPDAPPGTWRATGPDPQFVVPCLLPAGWLHVRLRMTSTARGRLEIYLDEGRDAPEATCAERVAVDGKVEQSFFLHSPNPVWAVRIDPLDVEGEFRLEELSGTPVPPPVALARALAGKLRLLWDYGVTWRTLGRGLATLLRGDLRTLRDKVFLGLDRPTLQPTVPYDAAAAYEIWLQNHCPTAADLERMRATAAAMPDPPLLSVLMPVHNVPEEYLRRAVESVQAQAYPHWELCIADDASTAPHVRPVLEEYARRDPRIRVVFRSERGNIAAASNTALELAQGEYIALLDHDDELAPHALFRMAEALVADRDLDMLYSDEDKLDLDGRRVEPFFKPDWSPDYFLTCMYTCHLGVYRTSLVRDLGGFRSEFDTAQDYDLALRVVARTTRIGHVPDVLYHWRKLPTSTAAGGDAKPEAWETARRAVQGHLRDLGREGRVEVGPGPGYHRVRYALTGRPLVSIIIPTACRRARVGGLDISYLEACVRSIRGQSSYRHVEIIAVDNDDMPAELARQMDSLGVRRVSFLSPLNLAAKMNLGAAKAEGDHLLFLNDDIEVITPDWLECMLEYSQLPEVAAVGARLLFPDGRLQHAGAAIVGGLPAHTCYACPGTDPGYARYNFIPRNVSAVTGACMMTRTEVFHGLGGFCEAFPLNYNDVDYCLRAICDGRRIVYTPFAQLYHFESVSRDPGTFPAELEEFQRRWAERWQQDPYYSPHFATDRADFHIRTDPQQPGGRA